MRLKKKLSSKQLAIFELSREKDVRLKILPKKWLFQKKL